MFRKAQYLPVSEDDPTETPLDQRPINKRTRNYGAIALAIVVIIGVIVLAILQTNDHASNKTSAKKGIENFRHQQPELVTVLKHDWQVGSLLHSNDKPWEKEHLLVPNGGFIVREIRGKKYYHGITMFHQLHCLAHVRSTMQLLIATLNGTVAIDTDGKPKSHEDLIQEVLDGHASHCFDYLKQTIQCSADSTIETPFIIPNGTGYITGYDIAHECRSNKVLYDITREAEILDED